MAHAGRDTGGLNFYLSQPSSSFRWVHTVFGQIDPKDEESLEVLDSIRQGDKILDIKIWIKFKNLKF